METVTCGLVAPRKLCRGLSLPYLNTYLTFWSLALGQYTFPELQPKPQENLDSYRVVGYLKTASKEKVNTVEAYIYEAEILEKTTNNLNMA